MIQYLKLQAGKMTGTEYVIVAGASAIKFFLKRILYIILFLYSTLFLAVAIPFVDTPFIPLYFIGGVASIICIARAINHAIMFYRYMGGYISVVPEGIKIQNSKASYVILFDSVKYVEHNILGNLVIHEKDNSVSFPMMLIAKNERNALLDEFQDMASKRTMIFRKIWEIVDAVAVALVLAVHIIQYIVQAFYIPTGSMQDTLMVGDHLFVEKFTYGPIIPQMMFMDKPIRLNFLRISDVKHGDIVIFRPPNEEDKDYIKRCIALPGDNVEFRDAAIYLNGEKLDEPYTGGKPTWLPYNVDKYPNVQGIVPPGKVLVLGDNRTDSQDGRYFGYIDIDRLKGRAFIMYWNSEYIFKKHDFSRFQLVR